jgi:hypothetical protein
MPSRKMSLEQQIVFIRIGILLEAFIISHSFEFGCTSGKSILTHSSMPTLLGTPEAQ